MTDMPDRVGNDDERFIYAVFLRSAAARDRDVGDDGASGRFGTDPCSVIDHMPRNRAGVVNPNGDTLFEASLSV